MSVYVSSKDSVQLAYKCLLLLPMPHFCPSITKQIVSKSGPCLSESFTCYPWV